ncbi:MAG: hypothetical protein AAGK14_12170 [Verrucomicrobiota bacterium]
MSITYKPRNKRVDYLPSPKPFQTGAGGAIGADHLVVLTLESAQVNTSLFHSDDEKRYEAVLQLETGNQTTNLTFVGRPDAEGMVKVQKKFLNRALYFGQAGNLDAVNVQLTESDEETRKFFDEAGQVVSLVAGSPMAAAHPAVAPGLSFISGILNLIKSHIKDDDECVAFLLREEKLLPGAFDIKLTTTKEGQEVTFLEVKATLTDLGAPDATVKAVSVHLTSAEINLERGDGDGEFDEGVKREIRRLENRARSMPDGALKDSIERQIKALGKSNGNAGAMFGLSMPNFNLEAGSGETKKGYSSRLPDIEMRMVLSKLLLTKAAAKPCSGSGALMVIPFSLEIGRSPDDFDAQQYFAVLEEGARLMASIRGSKPELPAFVEEKVVPSALGFLTEYLSQSLTIFSFNGVIVLQTSNAAVPAEAANGMMVFKKSGKKWTKTVTKDVSYRKRKLGSVKLTFEAVPVG